MRLSCKFVFKFLLWTLSSMYYFIPLQGQQIYKFPILHEGVYQLSQGQATDWGLGNLDQIRILGHPGMLDQKIDSSLFAQEEIPQLKIADKLYFFLEGPDQVYFDKGKAKIKEHHYTDTLYYLLQTGNPSTRKVTQVGDAIEIEEGLYSPKPLYQISLHKEEEDNILNSGRNWYGYRTFNSGSHIISISQPSANSEGPVTIWAQLMAQSFSESKFTFAANNQVLGEASIPSIPDSRYAIKGREVSFDANFPKPQGNKPQDIVLTYSSNHPNGTGYVKNILLGYPFSSSLLPEGVYYNPDDKPYPLQTTFSGLWDVSDFYQVKDLKTSNAQVIDSRKIVVFNPENTPEIASPEKVKERQDLLSGQPEFIIITSELLYGQAKRLSEFKNALGLSTEVVLTNAILTVMAMAIQI